MWAMSLVLIGILLAASSVSAEFGSSSRNYGACQTGCEDHESLLQLHHSTGDVTGIASEASSKPFSAWKKHCPLQPDRRRLIWDSQPGAGATVNGTLFVPLDYDDDNSPTIKLRVKMMFSKVQPAPNGPLLIHLGGPGSDHTHVHSSFAVDGYDTWAISQRGIGPEAEPRLLCTGSRLPPEGKTASYKISDFTDCPCALPDGTPQLGEVWADIDPENETQVEHLFTRMVNRSTPCYRSPKFQLKGLDGKGTYNFLDYVGTQLLARDIDRFREAIGADHMSIHGMSYGTLVGAVYGTVFPSRTHRLILNGNMMSLPQKLDLSKGCALAMNKAVAELLLTCSTYPQNCSLSKPEEEYERIIQLARAGELVAPTKLGTDFPLSVGMLTAYLQNLLHSSSGKGWPEAHKFLAALSPQNKNLTLKVQTVADVLDTYCFVNGKTTWYHYGICVGPGSTAQREALPGGKRGMADAFIEQVAVLGADTTGRFRVPDAMAQWSTVAQEYTDAGVAAFTGIFAGVFAWPAIPTPPSPLGNPDIKPIIVGNLYDPSTSYLWSQGMRKSFPRGSMITWQGVGHVLPKSGYAEEDINECQHILSAYLASGELPLDGHLCRQHVPVPVGF